MLVEQTKYFYLLIDRLDNWKFSQAVPYLRGQPNGVRILVETLSREYGNNGWWVEEEHDPTHPCYEPDADEVMTKREATVIGNIVDALIAEVDDK